MSEPAFPLQNAADHQFHGMSLRDYFAAHVDVSLYNPVGTLCALLKRAPTVSEMAEWIAKVRYEEADAMLKVRACDA